MKDFGLYPEGQWDHTKEMSTVVRKNLIVVQSTLRSKERMQEENTGCYWIVQVTETVSLD